LVFVVVVTGIVVAALFINIIVAVIVPRVAIVFIGVAVFAVGTCNLHCLLF